MTHRARLGAALLAGLLVATGCTGGGGGPSPTARPPTSGPPASPETVSPAPDGPGSALAALEELCDVRLGAGSEVPAEGSIPPAIADVMDAVEEVRGLSFTERVAVDAASHEELVEGVTDSFEASIPEDMAARKSLALETIGAIPPQTNVRDELLEFASSQVIGYYDPATGELVFIGEEDPSPIERVTLAHELTHAIDDQNFGLERLDALASSCRDEEHSAALAVVEGSATYAMVQYAQGYLTVEEQVEIATSDPGPQPDVPPFITQSQLWSYTAGLSFVQRIVSGDGTRALDRALRRFPVSTEQILHPERWPNDVPTPVDVPDLGPELGRGWKGLDVQHVGEAFLAILLDLRLDTGEAATAAAGWDGGIYRAWSKGSSVAVVLATTWDTEEDAAAFADSIERWIAEGGEHALVLPDRRDVRVLFASDPTTLTALEAAV